MKRIFTLLFTCLLTTASYAQLNCDNTVICDDFEAYVEGALGPQADHWTTWSGDEGGTEDGIVNNDSDFAFSGSKSLYIQGQGGPQDVLLLLGNRTSGNYRLDMKFYIFDGQRGYFNLQKSETPAVQWGQEVYFAEDGTGSIDAGGANAAQFTFPHDEWFQITQFIDLDNDRASLFIAGQAVHSWQFSLSSQAASSPILQMGAIDFYAISAGNHLYYIDDVRLTELPANADASRMVQLTVDMSLEDVSPDGVFVAGSFNGWDPAPMEHLGDNIYEAYVAVEDVSDYQYKFVNGAIFENGNDACGEDDGYGGYNRTFFTDTTSAVLPTICFDECVPCSEVSSTDDQELDAQVQLSPNPAIGSVRVSYELNAAAEVQVQLVNLMGQLVCATDYDGTTAGTHEIDLHDVTPGLYFVRLSDGQRHLSRKLVVR